jgi:hypothetical protein
MHHRNEGWRLLLADAADVLDRRAAGMGRAVLVVGSQAIYASRLRQAAARLRAASDDDSTIAPPDFDPAILTDPRRPYAAWDRVQHIIRQSVS